MATVLPETKMAYWGVKVGAVNLTSALKRFISSIKIKYLVDKEGGGIEPTTAEISIVSPSFIEDFLVEGVPIKVSMGWSPLNQVLMFSGEIVGRPDGVASDTIGYSITAMDKVLDMARTKKNKTFKIPLKMNIINEVIAVAGYIPFVDISDTNLIDLDRMPIQKNQTDLEFLMECADRWNCIMWENSGIIYFMDAEKAHDRGDLIRERTIEDFFTSYELNYKAGLGKNNVAKISWKKFKRKGGGAGSPGVKRLTETGVIEKEGDYYIEAYGQTWKLKKSIKEAILDNSLRAVDYARLGIITQEAGFKDLTKQYFVPVTGGTATNENLATVKKNRAKGFELSIDLNVGDPYLRPPRTAFLKSGTIGDKFSDLPAFLFHDNKNPSKYNINEVETTLEKGMIQTRLKATA